MASKVNICNMALSRIGASTITSLTDGTQEAKLCNTFFDNLADRAMMQGSWSSTLKRVVLAQTTNTPAFQYDYEYQLPVDPKCLKVLMIDEDVDGEHKYSIEDDKLLTDKNGVSIKYIAQITDPENYDPMLTEAIEVLLAAYLVYPLTGSQSGALEFANKYEELVDKNLAIDGQQGSADVFVQIDLTKDR